MRKLRYRDIETLAEGLTASKVWSRDPNLVGRTQEPRAQVTMLSFLEESEYFYVEWSFPGFSSLVGIMEKMEKYLMAGKSTLNHFGDHFITSNDFWNILFFMLKQDSDIVFCWQGL